MTTQIVTRTDRLRDRINAARLEWEELDSSVTSFAMRKRAETRYLTLLALGRAWGVQ